MADNSPVLMLYVFYMTKDRSYRNYGYVPTEGIWLWVYTDSSDIEVFFYLLHVKNKLGKWNEILMVM